MFIRRMIGEKRRYWAYKARTKRLPTDYRTVIDAVERYVFQRGMSRTESIFLLLDDLIDLFENAAANGTPIHDVVGDDPVEFAEDFIRNYADGLWIDKERTRLIQTVERISGEHGRPSPQTDQVSLAPETGRTEGRP